MDFLNSKHARVLTLALLIQTLAFYAVARRSEHIPAIGPLAGFPFRIGSWQMTQDLPLEAEVQAVLRADDTLNRSYTNTADGRSLYLFIAFFKTQRAGQSPHSPKNCLPGAGWEQISSDRPFVTVPGRQEPIQINRYVVEHPGAKSVVLYWYQSHHRVIASEYWAKFWLVADAIRYHRSDTALVKIVVPVDNDRVDAASATGAAFTQQLFPSLLRQLPQ